MTDFTTQARNLVARGNLVELQEVMRILEPIAGLDGDPSPSQMAQRAADRVKTLEAELRPLKSTLDSNIHYCDELEAENAELEAENAELRKALGPIASYAVANLRDDEFRPVMAKDIRGARAVLARLANKEPRG